MNVVRPAVEKNHRRSAGRTDVGVADVQNAGIDLLQRAERGSVRCRRAGSNLRLAGPRRSRVTCNESRGSHGHGSRTQEATPLPVHPIVHVGRLPLGSLAKREGESLHARIEELDLELSIDDRLWLPNQLIQPRIDHRAVAAVVHVEAVRRPGRLARQSTRGNAQALPWPRWSHDEMQVARVKAARDTSARDC